MFFEIDSFLLAEIDIFETGSALVKVFWFILIVAGAIIAFLKKKNKASSNADGNQDQILFDSFHENVARESYSTTPDRDIPEKYRQSIVKKLPVKYNTKGSIFPKAQSSVPSIAAIHQETFSKETNVFDTNERGTFAEKSNRASAVTLFEDREALRRAVLAREILSPPIALRE